MKRAGDILSLRLQPVENFGRTGGFFGDDLDPALFNDGSNFIRYAQVAGIPGADDKYLWFGGQNIIDIPGLQLMALIPPPARLTRPSMIFRSL